MPIEENRRLEEGGIVRVAKDGVATAVGGCPATARGRACNNRTNSSSVSAVPAVSRARYGGHAVTSLSCSAPSRRPCLCIGPCAPTSEAGRKIGEALISKSACRTTAYPFVKSLGCPSCQGRSGQVVPNGVAIGRANVASGRTRGLAFGQPAI